MRSANEYTDARNFSLTDFATDEFDADEPTREIPRETMAQLVFGEVRQ